jgi:hypothetical protein
MTTPQGIDKLCYGWEYMDVHDWVESRLEMAINV